MKTRQDNDMINHTGAVYVKNPTGQQCDNRISLIYTKTKIEPLETICPDVVCDEN